MNKFKSRALVVLLSMGLLLSGCQSKKDVAQNQKTNAPTKTEEKKDAKEDVKQEEWTFKDQADREVTVKIPVKTMAVMQHHSLDILAQLGATDKVIATEKNWEKDLGSYIKDVYPGVEKLKTPGTLKEWNVEEIAALKPDVVIAASQANKDQIAELEKLGIPVVVVSLRGEGAQKEAQNPRLSNADKAYTDGCEWAVKTLGKLTATEDRADKIWKFATESRKMVEDKLSDVKDEDRVRVFVANEGDQTYGNDKYVGAQLLRAGAINVASEDIQGYKPYTFEMLAKWNPDVILVQDRYPEVYKQITEDAKYKELKAVKDNKVILAPYWTKPWGNPDTDSIALGELWLAHIFYPEKIDKKTVEDRAKEFYKEFYGAEFTGTVE